MVGPWRLLVCACLVGLLGCTVLPWEESPPPAAAEENPPPAPEEEGPPPVTGKPPDLCTPRTCASASPACGNVPDGCGGVLDCGPCAQTPSATTVCEPLNCTPRTCEELGHECGWTEDGCGGWLRCGTCQAGKTCTGLPGNRYVCTAFACTPPTTCEELGDVCGTVSDGCGGELSCGGCPSGTTCGGGGYPGWCGVPHTLATCNGVEGTAALDALTGNVRGVQTCTGEGWCSVNAPMGSHLRALWGFAEDDVWAVGSPGLVLHWDGRAWSQVRVPTSSSLASVWGSGPNDVWVAGGWPAVVLHWDGRRWSEVPVPVEGRLEAVSGTAPDDVWVVGPEAALHWDGKRFSPTPGWEPLPDEEWWGFAARAFARDDVLAAGGGICRRWDGASWKDTGCGVKGGSALWASGPEDIWVVGTHSGVGWEGAYRAHWKGQTWSSEMFLDRSSNYPGGLRSVFGFASNDVWVNGTWHWDGSDWERRCRNTDQSALWGTRSDQLFGLAGARLSKFDGERWSARARVSRPEWHLGGRGREAWAVNRDGAVLVFDGSRWRQRHGGSGEHYFVGAFGSGPEDIWARASGGALWHWDGTTWTRFDMKNVEVGAGWAWSREGAILVGAAHGNDRGKVWLWDGTAWTLTTCTFAGDTLTRFWGSGADDVWAIGYNGAGGVVWHFDGSRWTRVLSGHARSITDVFGTSRDNVWVLDLLNGSPTTTQALRWNGRSFEVTGQFDNTYYLGHLAGTGPDDMWVAAGMSEGYRTRFYRFDGRAWTEVSPVEGRIGSMVGLPGLGVFAATDGGRLYQRLK